LRPFFRLDGQVRPGEGADQERVARHDEPRLLASTSVLDGDPRPEMIGVVASQDVLDLEAMLFREREVALDLPLRVDDRRLAAVSHDVGRAAKIVVEA